MSTQPPALAALASRPPRWLAWFCFVAVVTSVAVLARDTDRPDDRRAEADEQHDREAAQEAARAAREAARAAVDRAGGVAEPIAAAVIEETARNIALATPPSPPAIPMPPKPPKPPKPAKAAKGDLRTEERTYEAPKAGRFSVSIDSGDVTLVPASGSQIRVEVTARANAQNLADLTWRETQRDDGSLGLEIHSGEKDGDSGRGGLARLLSGRGSFFDGNGIERVRIEVPAKVALRLETGAGDVDGSDLAGNVHVESGAGDIELTDIGGDIHIETGAGDISIARARAAVEIETGAGDINVAGAPDVVSIETGAGSVTITGAPGRTSVATGVGEVRLTAESLRERVAISTGMGSIDLVVASGGFELQAESGPSSVSIEIDGNVTRTSGTGGNVRRTIGSGGSVVKLESGGGSISVRALDASVRKAAGATPPAGTTPPAAEPATSERKEPAAAGASNP